MVKGRVPETERFGKQNADKERQTREVRDALRIDGSQFVKLYEKMQALVANLSTTVSDLVNTLVPALTYTKAQVDTKIASPGNISPGNVTASGNVSASGNVTASGQVDSAGSPLKSQPSYNYLVATSYKSAWIDGVTYQVGYAPSSEAVKTSLSEMDRADADALLNMVPYWGRYLWDEPDSPPKVFFLAEAVRQAGFGPDIAPVVEGEPLAMVGTDGPILNENGEPVVIPVGEAYTVNYSQMVVPLLNLCRVQADQIGDLTARIEALEATA
jgi:hypothetical protein